MILISPAFEIIDMTPSQNLDTSYRSITILSRRSRTPSDLLHRALAHINYRTFDVGRLTIFEDPAIAVLNMFPKPANVTAKPSIWKRFKDCFYTHRTGVLLSVKVSSSDETKQRFTVRYVMEDSHQKTKSLDIESPETFIKDMFSAIPDISLCKSAN